MPVLSINIQDGRIIPAHTAQAPGSLREVLTCGGAQDAIVFLVHGYRYSPFRAKSDPHAKIFAPPGASLRSARVVSWPGALGFSRERADGPLCIPVGWDALGGFRNVYDRAAEIGGVLGGFIDDIAQHAPDRPIHIVAHSLGARVGLKALGHLRHAAVDRVVLLAPAEYATAATAAVQTKAGRAAMVLQVSPRENRVFDHLFERLVPRGGQPGRALGLDPLRQANWMTLPIDAAEDLARLAQAGHVVAGPDMRLCHRSTYLRPGLMDLYQSFMSDPQPLAFLRSADRSVPDPAFRSLPCIETSMA